MREFYYSVDGEEHCFETEGDYGCGADQVLSNADSDITYGQNWYSAGYKAQPFLSDLQFDRVRAGLEATIGRIVADCTGRSVDEFSLEKYHRFVDTDEDHLQVVSRTRDLFAVDFGFPVLDVVRDLEGVLGFALSTRDPMTGSEMHIIVRINRPGSSDCNPPHKDIYEHYDGELSDEPYLPRFMNFWIPICGVDGRTSLPLVPGSHLLPESLVERTRSGAIFSGKKYRVRAVRAWDGRSDLIRPIVNYGEALMFSGHLIHGLAMNRSEDTTRVSLEFRLFRERDGA